MSSQSTFQNIKSADLRAETTCQEVKPDSQQDAAEQPNPPPTGEKHPPSNQPNDQIRHRPEKNTHQADGQTPKSPTSWINRHAQNHLTRPNHPATGGIGTLKRYSKNQNTQSLEQNTHQAFNKIPKSSSHWKNPDAQVTSDNRITHRLEKSARIDAPYTTKTSTDWKKTPARQTAKRPNHPVNGGRRRPGTISGDQNIQAPEKSVRLTGTNRPNPPITGGITRHTPGETAITGHDRHTTGTAGVPPPTSRAYNPQPPAQPAQPPTQPAQPPAQPAQPNHTGPPYPSDKHDSAVPVDEPIERDAPRGWL